MINTDLLATMNESGHSTSLSELSSNLNQGNLDHSDIFKVLTTHLQCYALANECQNKLTREQKLGALAND